MSSYGQSTAIQIDPTYIASAEFRRTLLTELPCTPEALDVALATQAGLDTLVSDLTQTGALSATEAIDAKNSIDLAVMHEVSATAINTLTDMGFSIRDNQDTTALIWAERDNEVMALEVLPGGGFERDQAGIDNGRCAQVAAEFTRGMATRGITYQETEKRHNDPSGGALIRRANRQTTPKRRTTPPTQTTGTTRT
jgi:hypothetical protein